MKISRDWLQTYFEKPLPEAQKIADALTFHAFEIESVEGDVLDVKVTPNRGHDCLSHRAIAKELSAIVKLPMKSDPLRETVSLEPRSDAVKVVVEDTKLCPRFTGAYIKGLKVGSSPDWLRKRLEAVGQKSINNIVDATNYVMFGIGQPLHAFDKAKIKDQKLEVRKIKKAEKFTALDDKEYELAAGQLVIADSERTLSIAGIKGGKASGVTSETTEIFLEAANWDGVNIRRTSQVLKLRTDASDRFQQVISPGLAAYGTFAAAKLIVELCGGEIAGYVDEYPLPQKAWTVSVSTEKVNAVLGTKLSDADVADTFTRLGLPFDQKGSEFVVNVPFERLDLQIPEDLIEEVGRIIGYDKVPAVELLASATKPEINANFYAAEKAREEWMSKGYSEVYTSVFAEKGERAVLNKVGGEKPFLRTTLIEGLTEALEKNTHNKDLLGLDDVKLFEIGVVWKDEKETMVLGTADAKGVREEPLLPVEVQAYDDLATSTLERYQPFSRFPSITRDISLWVPEGTNPDDVLALMRKHAGELLVRSELFDTFTKPARPDDSGRSGGDGKTSLAFRLVFQSFDRTLMDEDAHSRMESVYVAVKSEGWVVR